MSCKQCGSERIMCVCAKCSDQCALATQGKDYSYYVPEGLGVGGGDYIEFDYCLECGMIQSSGTGNYYTTFPIPAERVDKAFTPHVERD